MAINRKPIRILQVFARMDRGGAETMIMELYRNVDRSKIQFDFVVHTTDKCAFDDEIIALGGKIHRVPKYTGKNHFKYQKAWNNLFTSYPEYRIIHAHVRSTATIFLKISKKYGLFTIAHSHSTSNGSGIVAVFKNILQKKIVKYSDYLLAASEEAGKWLFGSIAIKEDNFFVLNNAIDIENYIYNESVRKSIRSKLGFENKTVIGHVGNFKTVKNHKYLVNIYKEYAQLFPKSLLVLVGDGELKEEIQNQVRECELEEKVLFLGERSDVNHLLQAFDIFLMPSLYEGLPVTLIEAQAAGLPILASDTITDEVQITELVNFKSIEISPKLWAEDINKVLLNNRKIMSSKIKKTGYDIRTTAKWLETFYLKGHNKHQKDN